MKAGSALFKKMELKETVPKGMEVESQDICLVES